ncbi:MAG: hypothetical protein COW24_05370 [Candidatus Kerfeldbacteria bacterium CG15_BIG_FIL_POST_REV_8_21_14_020_45_12]|uniref:Prepilin-type N-terminal cleavage/methylation domain-containing protein n=1 Tax=Candidatus Kerfeldbacteria bacterium CG15_BIG_FIL_POST_REV_8_21_14_020_45_12 TaxID=2014247 RepID=A0A2M7H2J0_9BACT|nr:MAG: hypothetical protein COW24_05370 [Candidatus Kerfeldbacteria bacterium CG15_BIG_FIL_POST_REV_8_21_14_020_45_12]PJA93493.1 MAG: hypothetical protein CO132_02585 [Candidatus Kerfeldbacteria bacterium CG_4_9_14_3_um_filter_45_8]
MTGNTNSREGFTIIEVLVSTAVISIATALMLQLIMVYFSAQNRTYSTLYSESIARQMIADIGEHVFEGYIEYDVYPGGHPISMQEILPLRSLSGIETVYWFWTDAGGSKQLYRCSDVPQDSFCPVGGTVDPSVDPMWHKMNPDDIIFSSGEFRVFPDDNPFISGGAPLTNESPLVQVVMQLNQPEGSQSPLFETAFASRIYVR